MPHALAFLLIVLLGASVTPNAAVHAAPAVAEVDRAFIRLAEGLVHVRSIPAAATAPANTVPLVILHSSPSSSRAMEHLMLAMAARRPGVLILAPDALGNGDSAAPAPEAPDIAYFAEALARLLTEMDVERVDVYGSHTGARIAAEYAAAFPARVRRLILDGIVDYPDELRAQILANYAPPIAPDDYGRQMIWAFNFTRDQSLYFPYFMRVAEHRLVASVPSAEELHLRSIDILKALSTYHKPYLAAFRYRASERFPLIEARTLMLSSPADAPMLRASAAELSVLLRDGRSLEVDVGVEPKADAITQFLR
jgi:pimeloyl-ACP methyl ester carboxylesterase